VGFLVVSHFFIKSFICIKLNGSFALIAAWQAVEIKISLPNLSTHQYVLPREIFLMVLFLLTDSPKAIEKKSLFVPKAPRTNTFHAQYADQSALGRLLFLSKYMYFLTDR
jgi:hypothetical protein